MNLKESTANTTQPGRIAKLAFEVRGVFGRRETRRHLSRAIRQRWGAALLAAVYAAMPVTGRAAILEWTGNAPIFIAEYFNGTTTETREFEHALDWVGFCNTIAGSICQSFTLWGSPGNWTPQSIPSLFDTARVTTTAHVIVGSFNSSFQGFITGGANFQELSMADGSLLDLQGGMRTDGTNSYIDRMRMGVVANLINNGSLTINNLELASGVARGTGRTFLNSITAPVFETYIAGGHTVELIGAYAGSTNLTLESFATFRNSGYLEQTTGQGFFRSAQGTSNLLRPTVVNSATGRMVGSLRIDGPVFLNDGLVHVNPGQTFEALTNGTHSGRFTGTSDSVYYFGAKEGIGHHFLPSSSVVTEGKVIFSGQPHVIEGSFHAGQGVIGNSPATVRFRGPAPVIGNLTVNPASQLWFETSTGASLGDMTVGDGSQFGSAFVFFETGAPSFAQNVTLRAGAVNARGGLNVQNRLVWESGSLLGSVTVSGTTQFNAGQRALRGALTNRGMLSWTAGGFNEWSGQLVNAVGARFELLGDFSAPADVGSVDNAGLFLKSAGTGLASFPIAFNNRGTVDVRSGTLRLSGGGEHASATFSAAPGARIELAGGHSFDRDIRTVGRVDLTGGAMRLLTGASYSNTGESSIVTPDFTSGGNFANFGRFFASTFLNGGTVDNHGIFSATNVINAGLIWNRSSGNMSLSGNNLGSVNNLGELYLAGASPGRVSNDGRLFVAPGALLHVVRGGEIYGSGSVTASGGTLLVDGTINTPNLQIDGGGALRGSGLIVGNVDVLFDFSGLYLGSDSHELTINGTLATTGRTTFEIASSAQYGRLRVLGDALFNYGSLLEVVLMPGYVPVDGDDFRLLTATNIVPSAFGSAFDSPQVFGLLPDWQATFLVDQTSVRMSVFQEPLVDFSHQIPFSGIVTLPSGVVGANFTSGVALESLTVGGYFLNAPGGSVDLTAVSVQSGGTLANRELISMFGPLQNSGAVYNRQGAVMNLHGGVINEGRIANSGVMHLHGGVFRNEPGGVVTISGELIMAGGHTEAQIVNRGGFVVRGALRHASNDSSPVGNIRNSGTFTVEAGGIVEGTGSYAQLRETFFDTTIPVTRVNGVLAATDISFFTGVLAGTGRLVGNVLLAETTIAPGNSPGTLTIEGDLNAYYSTFEVELASATNFDRLHVTGATRFNNDNVVLFLLPDGFQPGAGNVYTWLASDGGITLGSGATFTYFIMTVNDDGAGGTIRTPWIAPDNLVVSFVISSQDGRLEVSPVPEPEQWLLCLAGLILVFRQARRRMGRSTSSGAAQVPSPSRGSRTAGCRIEG